jgi:hypothetical protein
MVAHCGMVKNNTRNGNNYLIYLRDYLQQHLPLYRFSGVNGSGKLRHRHMHKYGLCRIAFLLFTDAISDHN